MNRNAFTLFLGLLITSPSFGFYQDICTQAYSKCLEEISPREYCSEQVLQETRKCQTQRIEENCMPNRGQFIYDCISNFYNSSEYINGARRCQSLFQNCEWNVN